MNKETLNQLEKLCRQAYGAYEYLRDHDLSAESGTSKRLRHGDLTKLRTRLVEELGELRGVIEGTHIHEGFEQDIILEGYEVWYWAICWVVAQGASYEELQPHLCLEAGFTHPANHSKELLKFADDLINQLKNETGDSELIENWFGQVLEFVGMGCAINQTPPARLLERDIEEMRQKTYLAAYWQSLA